MKKLLIGAALVTFALTNAANATITISLGSGTDKQTFDNSPLGATSGTAFWQGSPVSWSTTGIYSNIKQGTALAGAGSYRAPHLDGTHYLSVGKGALESATLDWGKTIHSFTILWGSPDANNKITLSNGDVVTGADIGAALGFTANGGNLNTRWVNISDDVGFTGFTATSGTVAFEFDATAAPEPSTWALMLAGFGSLGFAGYRSKRRNAIAA